MKSLQAPNLKTTALTKAMYTVILRHEDEAFDDMSEESGNKKKNVLKTLSSITCCGRFQLKALLSRPNKIAN